MRDSDREIMSTIILQRFANREIRLGCQSIAVRAKNHGDTKNDKDSEKYFQRQLDLWVSARNVEEGYEIGRDRRGAIRAIPYTKDQHERLKRSLDIRNEFQRASLKSKNKGGWGFSPKVTAFGKNARHRLLEAGAIMTQLHGKKVAIVTCTIPGNTNEAFRTVSRYSGWIMNRLSQIVRRAEGDPAWFYVWELQKRGALHIHFAIGSSSLRQALSLAQEIECKWFDLLLELQDKCGVDVFKRSEWWSWRNLPQEWRSDVQVISKSVAAYFSKYASKQHSKSTATNKQYCPARWWGSSSTIKEGVNANRIRLSAEVRKSSVEEAATFLRDSINSLIPIKSYSYSFDLGQSNRGYDLGGGWREIFYFEDQEFESISGILDSLMEYVTQTWGVYADIPCLHADFDGNISYKGKL